QRQPTELLHAAARVVGVVAARKIEQVAPGQAPLRWLRAEYRQQTAAGIELIVTRGADRRAALALAGQAEAVTEFFQQPQLEQSERDVERHGAARLAHRGSVVGERLRMGVVAVQQPRQQLVDVERAEQRIAAQLQQRRAHFGLAQRLEFTAAATGDPQRLQRLQDRALRAAALHAARALGDRTQAAQFGREEFDDQAGVAVIAGVQHKGGK